MVFSPLFGIRVLKVKLAVWNINFWLFSGGIARVVFDKPTPIEAIRLYRRITTNAWRRYDKLSVTVKVRKNTLGYLITSRAPTTHGESAPSQEKETLSKLLIRNLSGRWDFRSKMLTGSPKFTSSSTIQTKLVKLLNLSLIFHNSCITVVDKNPWSHVFLSSVVTENLNFGKLSRIFQLSM